MIGAPFVARIHGLGSAENLCNLLLGQVVIFTKTSDFLNQCAHTITPLHYI